MGYNDGEILIANTLLELDEYNPRNVARADWLVLNSGNSPQYAIVRKGTTTYTRQGLGATSEHATHQTIIELWRHLRDSDDGVKLQAQQDRVKLHLQGKPFLGTGGTSVTVRDFYVVNTGPINLRWMSDGGPKWLQVEITTQWAEQSNV